MKLFFTKKELHLRKKRLILMAACLVVVIGLYVVLTWPKKVEPEAPLVIVEPVGVENVEIYGEYVGRIRAQQFVEVRARVEGFLESMEFEEGSYVAKNQALFVIDQRQYRAKADKARAQLRKDSANVLKTRRDLDRIRPLYEQNAASQLDLDNAIAAYETAVASMGMSQADLDQAEQELGYTVVRSPLSGYISERYVDLGALVGPGGESLLATVVKSDTVEVDYSMTALEYLKSRQRNVVIGQKDSTRSWQPYVTITLADNSEYPYKGMVDFADPQVDPKTGTFSVRAEMPNPDRVLLRDLDRRIGNDVRRIQRDSHRVTLVINFRSLFQSLPSADSHIFSGAQLIPHKILKQDGHISIKIFLLWEKKGSSLRAIVSFLQPTSCFTSDSGSWFRFFLSICRKYSRFPIPLSE